MGRLRPLRLFSQQPGFATEIGLATNVLDSLACLDALTIELHRISYVMIPHLEVFANTRRYGESKAETYQHFEESAIRLNPSRVLFVLRCNGRERTVMWTRTLQCILFPTLHKRCPFRVQCQRVHPDEPPYGHDRGVQALSASPDGRWIASASYDQTLIIWRVYRGDSGTVNIQVALDWFTGDCTTYKLQFSTESRYVASLMGTGDIYIWDVTTGTLLRTLGGLGFEITSQTCIAWLQDGSLVVPEITTETKRLLRWYTVASEERKGYGALTTPPSLAAPPDATYSLTDRGLVQLVDHHHQPTETVSLLIASHLRHSISPDGSLLAVLDADGSGVTMWDMDRGTPSRHTQLPTSIGGESYPFITVSDLATQRSFIIYRGDNWDYAIVDRVDLNASVAQGGITSLGVFDVKGVSRVWFSPCGRLFTTSKYLSSEVHLWRANDGMRLATFNHPYPPTIRPLNLDPCGITCVLFTQDSQTLVYGDSYGTVYVHDIGHLDVLAAATTTVAQ